MTLIPVLILVCVKKENYTTHRIKKFTELANQKFPENGMAPTVFFVPPTDKLSATEVARMSLYRSKITEHYFKFVKLYGSHKPDSNYLEEVLSLIQPEYVHAKHVRSLSALEFELARIYSATTILGGKFEVHKKELTWSNETISKVNPPTYDEWKARERFRLRGNPNGVDHNGFIDRDLDG